MSEGAPLAIRIRGLRTQFGSTVIHDDLDLDVRVGEIMGVVGGSGTGKSVLLRTIVGLNKPVAGTIEILGHDATDMDDEARGQLESVWGVLCSPSARMGQIEVIG